MGGFLLVLPAHAATTDVTQLKITTAPQTGEAGMISTVFKVETENSSGDHVKVGPGSVTLNLTSDSVTGQFFDANFSTNTCTSSTSTLSMASSSYQKGFCYQDSTPGVHFITVTAQSQSWTKASQSFTIPFITNDQGGVTFTSIQDAVDHTTAGGTITLPAGTYSLTSELDINSGISISGQGDVTIQANNPSWDITNGGKYLFGLYGGILGSPISISNITFDCTSQCYGLNTYGQANVVLTDVTIKNSKGAALTVNGSTVTASDLDTSGNHWGAVNVDPGSGVTSPSSFTLSSGTLSEDTQIWSDGSNVTDTATVTVTAPGYTEYHKGGTNAFYVWSNRSLTDVATIPGTNGIPDFYTTIQDAITNASEGDTITVGAGTYAENIVLDKMLTLQGAGSGTDGTIITSGTGNGISVTASGSSSADPLLIKDIQVSGDTNGVYFDSKVSHIKLENVAILDNTSYGIEIHNSAIIDDLVLDNATASGNNVGFRVSTTGSVDGLTIASSSFDDNDIGLYTTANSASTTNQNDFTNVSISNTTFSNDANKGIYAEKLDHATFDDVTVDASGVSGSFASGFNINLKYGTYSNISIQNSSVSDSGTGDTTNGTGYDIEARDDGSYSSNPATLSGISINGGSVTDNQTGIRFGETGKNNAGPTDVTINGVSISGNITSAINNQTQATVDASGNWWGLANADPISLVLGTVTTSPWCEQVACTSTRSTNVFIDLNNNGSFDSATETGYTTITAALALVTATSSQTNIFVDSGTYDENLVINKPIDLHNDARDDDGNPVAVLDGTIQVTNSYGFPVDISGLEITAPDSSYGIYVHGVGEVNIYDNYIHDIGTSLVSGSAQAIDIEPGVNSISTIFINHNLITNVGSLDLVKGTGGTSAKGIYLGDSSGNSAIDGVTITNNTISSIFAGTTAFPAGRGAYGILDNYGGQTTNLKISGNTIHHLEGLWSHAIGLEADTPSAVVASNSISDLVDHKGNTDAVGVHFEDNPSASTATVSGNSFGSGVALGVDNTNGSSYVVTANDNWWNDPAGPTATDAAGISSDVTAGVYYINPGLTVLSNAVQNGNLTATSGDLDFVASASGAANLPSGVSTLTLSNSTVLNLSNNIATASGNTINLNGTAKDLTSFSSGNLTDRNLTTPVMVGSASVTVTKAVALKSGSASEPIHLLNSDLSNVDVVIPDSTTVLAPNGWDGKIQPPKSVSASGTAPSGFSVGGTVVEVGSPDGVLLFDQPVSVVLTGVTGDVGYLPAGSSTWVHITDQCSGTYDSPTAPSFPGECFRASNGNTKIYTYHFTSFASLSEVTTSNSSGGGGGYYQTTSTPTPTPSPAVSPTPSPTSTPAPRPSPVSAQANQSNVPPSSSSQSSIDSVELAQNLGGENNIQPTASPFTEGQQASILGAIGNIVALGTGQWWMAVLVLVLAALAVNGIIRRRYRNNIRVSDQLDDESHGE
ncbi:MAG TPA: hypothetical protein VFK07_02765 [Candidatus Paceibacterota bacterium]|nr:hypothetical protein [Candidatus Paceibacterota bacterium]